MNRFIIKKNHPTLMSVHFYCDDSGAILADGLSTRAPDLCKVTEPYEGAGPGKKFELNQRHPAIILKIHVALIEPTPQIYKSTCKIDLGQSDSGVEFFLCMLMSMPDGYSLPRAVAPYPNMTISADFPDGLDIGSHVYISASGIFGMDIL